MGSTAESASESRPATGRRGRAARTIFASTHCRTSQAPTERYAMGRTAWLAWKTAAAATYQSGAW